MIIRQTDTLWISSTNHLKALAILMVIISHYCRYVIGRTDYLTQCLGGIGFLGAALFAFLSGYGVCTSLKRKGMRAGWLRDKFIKVYLPFVAVNVISYFFLYDVVNDGQERFLNTNVSLPQALLWCGYDFVQWYVPYIMIFYLLVWLIYIALKIDRENYRIFFILMLIASALQIGVGITLNISSNWYTSTGALLAGVYLADARDMSKSFLHKSRSATYVLLVLVFVVFLGFSQTFNIFIGKEIRAVLVGILFSVLMFYIAFYTQYFFEQTLYMKIMQVVGKASLWMYILHFKVIYCLNPSSWLILPVYLFISVAIAIIINKYWLKVLK